MSRDARLITSRIGDLMTRNTKTITSDRLASEAL